MAGTSLITARMPGCQLGVRYQAEKRVGAMIDKLKVGLNT